MYIRNAKLLADDWDAVIFCGHDIAWPTAGSTNWANTCAYTETACWRSWMTAVQALEGSLRFPT